MSYTIDIDTGGTFTDGFFTRGEEFRAVKTPTTPHDLTVCFLECIKEGAKAFGVAVEDLLFETDIVRFCNTIGTNSIIQRDGAKIGLLLTAGAEHLAPTSDPEGKKPLVYPDMVLGLDEAVGMDGAIHRAPDGDAVLDAAQTLVDRGARCLVVAFANGERNPANERSVRELIKVEYPRDYLGSVPVFLASDITSRSGYAERVNTAALNAYIHGKLTRLLYKAGEELRRRQYRGQLLIGHNNGSVARVAKTRAINTYNSGPTAGLLGAHEIGALYGSDCVISGDMGGTSFDIGWTVDGEPSQSLRPDVEGFACNLPMLSIRALGAGGGSIASVQDGQLAVGPQSAGALPGPACFGLGGALPTVTDANVVLGLLDPDFFLGGTRKLDVAKARAAIEEKVARPLGIAVEEAARRIKDKVDAAIGIEVGNVRRQIGATRRPLMVIYGGAGPLHACAIAEHAGIETVVITPFSAVFSAYSSSLMDVGHLYYRSAEANLHAGADISGLQHLIADLRAKGEQDMRGEGFGPEVLSWMLDLVVESEAGKREAKITAEMGAFAAPGAMEALVTRARQAVDADAGEAVRVTALGVFVKAPVHHFRLTSGPKAPGTAADAVKATRTAAIGGATSLPVYDRTRLGNGHSLAGPAIVESDQTTILIEQGWVLSVDAYNNLLLNKGR